MTNERACPDCGTTVLSTDAQCMGCGATLSRPQPRAAERPVAVPTSSGPGTASGAHAKDSVLGRVFGKQVSGDHVQIIVTDGGLHIADVMLNAPPIAHLAGFGTLLAGAVCGAVVGLLILLVVGVLMGAISGGSQFTFALVWCAFKVPMVAYAIVIACTTGGAGAGWSLASRVARLLTTRQPGALKHATIVSVHQLDNRVRIEPDGSRNLMTVSRAMEGADAVVLSRRTVKQLTKLVRQALKNPRYAIPSR